MPSNPKYKENDYQAEQLDDEVIANMFNTQYVYPKQIKLLSNGKFKCRKIPYVLQYYVSNKENCLTCFFMYYSLRDEIELFSSNPPTYSAKLAERGIIKVVNQNYSLVEPFATIVDDSFKRISSDIDNNMDPHG